RQSARRSASRLGALRIVGDGSEARARAGAAVLAIRAADLSRVSGAEAIRLFVSRSGDARDAAAGDRADRRSAALRPARLAGEFSEPGLAEALWRLRAGVRRAISVGALFYAGERDLCDGAVL